MTEADQQADAPGARPRRSQPRRGPARPRPAHHRDHDGDAADGGRGRERQAATPSDHGPTASSSRPVGGPLRLGTGGAAGEVDGRAVHVRVAGQRDRAEQGGDGALDRRQLDDDLLDRSATFEAGREPGQPVRGLRSTARAGTVSCEMSPTPGSPRRTPRRGRRPRPARADSSATDTTTRPATSSTLGQLRLDPVRRSPEQDGAISTACGRSGSPSTASNSGRSPSWPPAHAARRAHANPAASSIGINRSLDSTPGVVTDVTERPPDAGAASPPRRLRRAGPRP